MLSTKPAGAWKVAASGTAELIAHRLTDPAAVDAAVRGSQERARYPFGWGGASLYAGHAGNSLLFRCAARVSGQPTDYWLDAADQQVFEAVRSTHDVPIQDPGLAAGTAGMVFALSAAAAADQRYRRALTGTRRQLCEQIMEMPTWRSTDGVCDGDYDLVTGAAGMLLCLTAAPGHDSTIERAVDRLIDDLVWLTAARPDDDRQPWFIPPRHFPAPDYHREFPHGYVNLGLAHGIPGVLAALAIAWSHGHHRPGMREAIGHTAGYLRRVAGGHGDAPVWSTGVPLTPDGDDDRISSGPARQAWCYGNAGVARALLHAATALDDDGLRRFAISAFESGLRRIDAHDLASATLCHGVAGLLVLCDEFGRAGSTAAAGRVPSLVGDLLSHCDAQHPLGVQDLEQPGSLLDSPGLLTGAAGVALTLWTVSSAADRRWLRAFAIA